MRSNNDILVIIVLALFTVSCEDLSTNLDVDNVEDPNSVQLGSESTVQKLFQNWYFIVNHRSASPSLAMATMSDMHSCSWANFAMNDTSSEPRVAWNNNPDYPGEGTTNFYFSSMHSVLADANAVITAMDEGAIFSDNNKVRAIARMAQALSIGYLALNFDRVWLSDETGSINNGEAVGYQEAMDFALSKLDDAISIADSYDFVVDGIYFNSADISSSELSQLLNSFGARLLVNSVRNSSQRDILNWTDVLVYTNNGITNDFKVKGNGLNDRWVSGWPIYTLLPGWVRVDMRVINLMDPNTPDYWPGADPVIPESTSADDRLISDFQYINGQNFRPSRGAYHYSSYRFSRYDWFIEADFFGNYPEMLKAEIDLYKAEALLRTGDLSGAATLINTGTRVTRGNLPQVPVDADKIAAAIHYERSIELMSTGSGLAFYEMRREDLLQTGTLLHFPIPGSQLQAAGLEYYTYGGTEGVPGEDYSEKGWRD